MIQEEILEGNKLIAEFMGAKAEQWYSEVQGLTGVHYVFPKDDKVFPDNKRHHPEAGLKYDSDWNWLMPVIEKIETMNNNNVVYNVLLSRHSLLINTHSTPEYIIINFDEDKLKAAFKTVVEFIKWCNER